jgi:co-chaperonin GroES (HSP10)
MSTTKEIALSISAKMTFEPSDDKVIIKPLKPVMVTKEFPVVPKAQPKDADVDSIPEVKEFEKRKVEANVQKGVILKLGTDILKLTPCPYEVGDVVMFLKNAGIPFELFKDSKLIRRYDILGKVNE